MATIALVTGASRGLGRETVRRLGELGWTVLLAARDPERGAAVAAELRAGAAPGADVRVVPLDVTSDESVQSAAKLVEATHGRLDVLVNNAGITRRWSWSPAGWDHWQ